ncbi:MAG: DUF2723 domain-containing protein [Bacteroidetes bacterium]|nr:DUF2723 domain-containing protein [Bacteroidota bacterium]
MDFFKYSRFNNMTGWLVFAIALFTYTSTQEATVSLWDCGEFIPASYKLQVVHPPGAPFFLMLNHFFTIVAKIAKDPSLASTMVNFSSALMSALTILFLFWTITALASKMVFNKVEGSLSIAQDQLIVVLASGVVGALAYTWSDTFWFSAVEGEVYAMSSMFIALVSWLMMKWERRADEPDNVKWIVLICFLLGLSSGVHLMSLLAIPAMAVVYYYRKFKNHSWKGLLVAAIIGVVLLGLIQVGVVTGIPTLMTKFELMFVNGAGMPFWSGVFVLIALIIGLFVFGLFWTYKKGRQTLHVLLLCGGVVFIGYSSYTMVVVRSLANPAIDMNDPQDVFSLLSYLNREQYGDRPVVKGPNFDAFEDNNGDGQAYDGILRTIEKGDIYRKGDKEYEFVDTKKDYEYKDEYMTVFPRMGSNQDDHAQAYREWSGLMNQEKVTLGANIKFFFKYQLGHMWWRYFGWNFIGRQNDIQGHGSSIRGNYITGLDFIDKSFLGMPASENLPDGFKNDKSRNALYGLPFLLGLLGFIYHARKDQKSFVYTLIYFGMTGIALVVYLNMPPYQPRERDYVFVGSFYFFAIWIGLGLLMLYDFLKKSISPNIAALLVSVVCLVAVPVKMVAEEWDDHDRSNRKVPLAFGRNYLESCPPNAILFTNGDNDTYPLWYAQEVEGIRKDVRIINLSLLNTDWYTNQHRRPVNDAAPVPMSMNESAYVQGRLDYIEWSQAIVNMFNKQSKFNINTNDYLELKDVVTFISSDNNNYKLKSPQNGEFISFIPTRNYKIAISEKDKDNLIEKEIFSKGERDLIVDEIKWKYRKNRMMKADLVTLDIIATNAANGWERPICWAITTGSDVYENLMPYLRMEGMVYHLVPMRRYVVTYRTINQFRNSINRMNQNLTALRKKPKENAEQIQNIQARINEYSGIGSALDKLQGRTFYKESEFRNAINSLVTAEIVDKHWDRVYNSLESNDIPQMEGFVGTSQMSDNVLNKFDWGGLESEEDMWVDFVMNRSCRNLRTVFSRLAMALADEADREERQLRQAQDDSLSIQNPELGALSPEDKRKKAIETLNKGLEAIPERTVPYSYLFLSNEMMLYSELYYRLGEKDAAYEIDQKLIKGLLDEMEYFMSFSGKNKQTGNELFRQNKYYADLIIENARKNGKDASEWQERLKGIMQKRNPGANQSIPQFEGNGNIAPEDLQLQVNPGDMQNANEEEYDEDQE